MYFQKSTEKYNSFNYIIFCKLKVICSHRDNHPIHHHYSESTKCICNMKTLMNSHTVFFYRNISVILQYNYQNSRSAASHRSWEGFQLFVDGIEMYQLYMILIYSTGTIDIIGMKKNKGLFLMDLFGFLSLISWEQRGGLNMPTISFRVNIISNKLTTQTQFPSFP